MHIEVQGSGNKRTKETVSHKSTQIGAAYRRTFIGPCDATSPRCKRGVLAQQLSGGLRSYMSNMTPVCHDAPPACNLSAPA